MADGTVKGVNDGEAVEAATITGANERRKSNGYNNEFNIINDQSIYLNIFRNCNSSLKRILYKCFTIHRK